MDEDQARCVYLGGLRHGVPAASSQGEATTAYPAQYLLRSVLRPVGKWSEAGKIGENQWKGRHSHGE